MYKICGFASLLVIGLAVSVMAAGEQSLADLIAQEESGIEMPGDLKNEPVSKIPGGPGMITNTIPQDSVLFIPNDATPEAVYMFDPYDGHSLGIFLTDDDRLATPQCAIKGPDGNVYLSDQVGARGVHVYDTSGTFLYTYCDTSDGLYNVRGIDFRNDTLFVTSGNDYVAMFDGPHSRLPDFIPSGMDPYDIHFLDDGSALVADITGDNIRRYNADGTFSGEIINTNFPEQVTYDDLAPGDFITASFSDHDIKDFDLDGTIQQTTPLGTPYGRGVYRLGNGNLLASISTGVFELDPGTGNVINTIIAASGFHMIELFVLESGPSPLGRCCYNNYQDCVDTSQAACVAIGGVWDGALNCTDDPCPANPYGRCCYNNNADCVDTLEAACTAIGGTWSAGLTCIDDPCPTGGGCDYVVGDVNGSDNYNGLDITYGVNFFKYGTPDPLCNPDCPPCQGWHYCGDVNASCNYNGLDITYGVNYFKYGSPAPQPCDDCPPIR